MDILTAGEAMGKQSVGPGLACRLVEERREPLPVRAGKIEAFSGHVWLLHGLRKYFDRKQACGN